MRRPTAILVAGVAAGLILLPVPPPASAAAPSVVVERADPLMTDPVTVVVAAQAADGTGVAFSGTATLVSGPSSASVPVAAAAGGTGVARIRTAALRGGSATLRVRLRIGGRTVTRTLPHFADLPPGVEVAGFSCTAVPRGGAAVRWAVTSLWGDPVRTPNSRDLPLLPYVPSSRPRAVMTTADGLPMRTSGTVVVRSGTKRVAVLRLRPAVRRLVFGSVWNGRVRGAFRPGAYTAQLVLKDSAGRVATAEQPVAVVRAGIMPCGV